MINGVKRVILGLKRIPDTNEYKVTVKVGNRYDEGKAYYTNDILDAVNTAFDMEREIGAESDVSVSFTKELSNARGLLQYGHPLTEDELRNQMISEENIR